jgi:hypothetical protein
MHSQGDDPSQHDAERYYDCGHVGCEPFHCENEPADMAHPEYVAAMQDNATAEWEAYEAEQAHERYEHRLRIVQWVLIVLIVAAFVAYAGSR